MSKVKHFSFSLVFFLFTIADVLGLYKVEVTRTFRDRHNCVYVIFDVWYNQNNNASWETSPGWVMVLHNQSAKFCPIVIPEDVYVPPDSAQSKGYYPFGYNGLDLSDFPQHACISFSNIIMNEDSSAKLLLPSPSNDWFVSLYDFNENGPVFYGNITSTDGFVSLPRSYTLLMERRKDIVVLLIDRTTNKIYILHDWH